MTRVDQFALAWFAALSVITFLAFGWDKWRAGRGARRVSEATLVWLAALGGWPVGLFSMKHFRHKTAKRSFQIKFTLALLPFTALVWAWWRFR